MKDNSASATTIQPTELKETGSRRTSCLVLVLQPYDSYGQLSERVVVSCRVEVLEYLTSPLSVSWLNFLEFK